MNSNIQVLAGDGSGNLYAGGNFTVAGEVSANRIAKWNGANWSALGSGITINYVNALAVDGSGNLFVGGSFPAAGGVAANFIAKWDGTNWSALGSGLNGFVSALAVDGGGNVYAGGSFTTAGGVGASCIAKWDGTSWSALGSGTNAYIKALVVDRSGNLYAGGSFTTAGGVGANRIAKWDGTSWSVLGNGMNSDVNALALDGSGNLYAGGYFTTAGEVGVNRIAKWDGTSWSALGSGIDGYVYALAVDGSGNLYVGGLFTTAGEVGANYIAEWDGTSWSALGSGVNNRVYAIAISGSDLYAGGGFTTAGGKPSSYFGRYTLNTPPTADAGADQAVITATGSSQITLNGSGSSDPDGDPLTYTWSENGNVIANSVTSQVALSVGSHTIKLTVGDGRGGTATGVVTITVKSAEDAIEGLIATVNSLNIKDNDKGIKNALLTKLGHAQTSLQNGENQVAAKELDTFIQQVSAQRGKALTEADADALIAQAQVVIAAINAASAPKAAFSATEIATMPNSYELEQNYPNPFNPVTTIQFSVPRESYVRLKVYNSFGAEVATLVDRHVTAGTYKVNWDASRLASGFYLYRLEAEGFSQTKKLLLMK